MLRFSAYIAFIAVLTAGVASPSYADIFKYVDEEGVVHFTNVPGTSADRVIKEDPGTRPAKTLTAKASYTATGRPKAEPVSLKSGGAPSVHLGQSSALPATLPAIQPSGQPVSDEVPYADIINAKCDKYGVEPSLVKAIIKAESNFNPTAVSSKGARGLMQLMPMTASDMDVRNSFDPEQNIDGGVRYFRYLLDTFGGDVELSVAAFNCGQGRVIRNGNCVPEITETKDYVRKVMKLSDNPVTGVTFSRTLYKIELKDGSIMFTDSPVSGGPISLVE